MWSKQLPISSSFFFFLFFDHCRNSCASSNIYIFLFFDIIQWRLFFRSTLKKKEEATMRGEKREREKYRNDVYFVVCVYKFCSRPPLSLLLPRAGHAALSCRFSSWCVRDSTASRVKRSRAYGHTKEIKHFWWGFFPWHFWRDFFFFFNCERHKGGHLPDWWNNSMCVCLRDCNRFPM